MLTYKVTNEYKEEFKELDLDNIVTVLNKFNYIISYRGRRYEKQKYL